MTEYQSGREKYQQIQLLVNSIGQLVQYCYHLL